MTVLVVVDMHKQGLAAAGGVPEGYLVKVAFFIWFYPVYRFLTAVKFRHISV
jgi:hypothetical protein